MKLHHSGMRFHWLVIGPFLIVVALLAALGVGSAHILSAVRAYVGGESLWSKGQKDAVYRLAAYTESQRGADYQRFADAIAVPLGARQARTELERPDPDLGVARSGFLQVGNHPDDIDAMIWLFRNFRNVPFMADALAIWAEGDVQIAQLNEIAGQLHQHVLAGDTGSPQARTLLAQLEPLNQRLTGHALRFSATMGQASRTAQRLIELATLVLALGLAAVAVFISSGLLRRQARVEAALRASEQRFRQLWETAPDAIVMFGADQRIQYANAAMQGLFGHEPSALVGQEMALLQPEGSREAHRRGVARYLQTRRKTVNWRSTEAQGLHRDGREFPVEIAFSYHEHNGEHQFAGFLRDTSARRLAEQALRASEERLQRALDASGLCLWDLDPKSGSVFLSEGWSLQLGGPPEVTRTTFTALLDLVPESERPPLMQAFVAAVKNPQAHYRVEHRVKKHDGQWIWNLSEGRVVERDAEGRALRLVGTNRDITERKVAETTRRGLEAQLRESQKMEAVGMLAAGIAHDFNNILGAILGNLALAREDVGAGNAALHSLEQINKSALRARSLIQQILAFSRNQPQELVNQPLRPMLQETLALMRSTLPAGVSLDASLADAPLHVLADATQFQQVLMNLCTNAWHALQGETGRIGVGLECVPLPAGASQRPGTLAPGEYAHVWVSDTGCGMDLATRARIFDPFFTTKAVGQGTGLGLSVVDGIVAAHHGAISVDSALGQGSTFHLYLPLVDPDEPAPPSGWGALPALQRSGQGQHVLYLDDDEVMLLLVERLLRRLGYRVSCFRDPHQALAAVRARPLAFDLVISDFNMPELSGLDVARELARIRAELPVVISSGYLTEEQRADLLRAGVRDLLRKESTLEELGPAAQRWLKGAVV